MVNNILQTLRLRKALNLFFKVLNKKFNLSEFFKLL